MQNALLTFVIITLSSPISLLGHVRAASGAVTKSSEAAVSPSPTNPVVVELFTSEGCSDCPPADRLLYSLEQTQPVPGAQVIPLELHVDYWDNEGWRDPFSSAQLTLRQKDYVYAFNLQTPYTPEMVVDGIVEFVGSDRNRALAAIAKAAQNAKANLKFEYVPARNAMARDLRLYVTLDPPVGLRPKHSADVFLVITEDYLASNVTQGENAGAHLNHLAVVRELRLLGRVDSGGAFSASPEVSLASKWKRENLHAVVFVQDRSTRRILAASALCLSQRPN